MLRVNCASMALLAAISVLGQWEAAGVPFRIFEMGNIHRDAEADALYFCGESSLNNDFDVSDGAVPVYTNGQWDTLGVFGGRVQTTARWADTLVAGGSFFDWNGDTSVRRCAYLDGAEWRRYGDFDNSIYRLKVINGDLYALGAFDVVDGQSCQGIAKRMSGQWAPVGSFDVINPPNVQDLVDWNGTLYATGTIRFGAPNPKDIAYLSPSGAWLPLGPGIQGGFGAGRSLAVYNNELYVGGSIQLNAGNAGHGIMRWDGEQFHAVGGNLQGIDGTTNAYGGALELEVYDNKLWACGTFSYAGNVPSPGIAYWDGSRWCGLPAGIQPEVNSIEFFHDTLFASCANWDLNCAMRYTGDHYSDTCSVAMGMEEGPATPRSSLRTWRRDDGLIEIMGVPSGRFAIVLNDATGRCMRSGTITVAAGGPATWDTGPLSGGYYLLEINGVGAVRFLGR